MHKFTNNYVFLKTSLSIILASSKHPVTIRYYKMQEFNVDRKAECGQLKIVATSLQMSYFKA